MDSSVPPQPRTTGTLAELGPDGSAVVLRDDGVRQATPAGSVPAGVRLRVGQRVRVLEEPGRSRVALWEPELGVHPAQDA